MNLAKLKKLGAEIKNLPPGDRKAAGLKFQALKAQMEVEARQEKVKEKPLAGKEVIWSLSPGPWGNGVVMYQDEIHLGTDVSYNPVYENRHVGKPNGPVVIRGQNLTIKGKGI